MASIVATIDVVGSSILKAKRKKRLMEVLGLHLQAIQAQDKKIQAEVFRGDSMQLAWKKDGTDALRMVLWTHMQLLKEGFEIRTGIGIGNITIQTSKPGTSHGTAFEQSGAMLDQLKNTPHRIGITGTVDAVNSEWEAHSASLNYVLSRCSLPQAQAIALQLENKAQLEIAALLGIKQPAVHQRLQAGGWPVLHAILKRFQYIASN